MTLQRDIEFAKVLGNLYSEVFEKRRTGDNSVLKKSTHNVMDIVINEYVRGVLITSSTNVWGPGGQSPEVEAVALTELAGRWGEATWS